MLLCSLFVALVAFSISSVHAARSTRPKQPTFVVRGFNSRAYKNGSDFPEYKNGTMRVYGMRFCPYTHRLLLMLSFKNISCELININMKNKPDWYYDINPLGKIPCLQYDEKVVCGSVFASEWLDGEFDGTYQLMPDEPYKIAKQKSLLTELEQAVPAAFVYKALYFNVMDSKTFGSYEYEAAKYEELLKNRYFSGPKVGWVDLMIWPQLEKIELIPLVFKTIPHNEKFPKFSAYLRRMRFKDEVKRVRRPARDHLKFAISSVKDKPNYDFGIV